MLPLYCRHLLSPESNSSGRLKRRLADFERMLHKMPSWEEVMGRQGRSTYETTTPLGSQRK